MPRLFLLVAATMSVMSATPALAQSAERVDVDLVRAYFYIFQLAYAQVAPGVLPDGMDPALVPSGATVLGTLTADQGGTGDDEAVFARTDRSADALFEALYETPPTGWTFRESGRYWVGDGLTIAFCSADEAQRAWYNIVPDPEGGTFVVFGIDGSCLPEDVDEAVVITGDMEYEDVIGDGEIIDEPGDIAPSSVPDLPEIDPEGNIIQFVDGFGHGPNGGERPGAYSAVYLREHTVASAEAGAEASFQADGWSRLGTHSADGTHVSVWSRTNESGQQVIATLTVRANGDGAEVAITATR